MLPRRDYYFNIDACLNVFMTVAYDADGKWEIRLPKGKPGDYMIMTALMVSDGLSRLGT